MAVDIFALEHRVDSPVAALLTERLVVEQQNLASHFGLSLQKLGITRGRVHFGLLVSFREARLTDEYEII